MLVLVLIRTLYRHSVLLPQGEEPALGRTAASIMEASLAALSSHTDTVLTVASFVADASNDRRSESWRYIAGSIQSVLRL